MTPEQLDEIEKLAEAWERHEHFSDAPPLAKKVLPLVKALREARKALDEREGDMHDRIRAGYDKTVADMWRAHCAKIEKERDEARSEAAELRKKRNADLLALEKAMDASAEGSWMARALDAERERDDARRKAEKAKADAERHVRDTVDAERRLDEVMNAVRAASGGGDVKSMEETIRAAGAEIEQLKSCVFMLEAERDDARAELEHAVAEGGALYEAKVAQSEAEQERDEAWALVVALKEEHRPADEVRAQLLAEIEAHAETKAEVERLKVGRGYDAKVIPDLVRELEEAKLLLSIKMETVESMRQTVAEMKAEVERLRSALRLLWEEAQDESRCQVESGYGHLISQPCWETVTAALKEGDR